MHNQAVRLLALDGGGIRGLSSLKILEELMIKINPESPPKPCDYFDMIAGTSTGGLIAIMLGRLEMSISECIAAYMTLSESVFRKKRQPLNMFTKVQGRFDAKTLEEAVKDILKWKGLHPDTLLKDNQNAKCKTFVCATSNETGQAVQFANYPTMHGASGLLDTATIWQACRATSAAPSFFEPITIGHGGQQFFDGATGTNNPVVVLWEEALALWGFGLHDQLECIVSIGTGMGSFKPFGKHALQHAQAIIAIATESEATSEHLIRSAPHLRDRFFRFNVPHGLENIAMEDVDSISTIAAVTRQYIATADVVNSMYRCRDGPVPLRA